jgi:type IV pilus assembly protein PilV
VAKYTVCNKGFTLVEILIALVILSVGLLGLAALQMSSLKLLSDSYYRSIAVIQANDMRDRMRANNPMVKLGVSSPYNLKCESTGCVVKESQHPNCFTTGCTPEEMAREDIYEWLQNLSNLLPSGIGTVCVDSSPDDGKSNDYSCDNVVNTVGSPIFSIKIFWRERKNDNKPYHKYIGSFSL